MEPITIPAEFSEYITNDDSLQILYIDLRGAARPLRAKAWEWMQSLMVNPKHASRLLLEHNSKPGCLITWAGTTTGQCLAIYPTTRKARSLDHLIPN